VPEERVLAEDLGMLPLNNIFDVADGFGSDILNALDMLPSEQEMLWINVAVLDETFGLLGAAAGVGLVHQAALVIHEARQVAACAGQALTKVDGGHLQNLAAHRVTRAEDLAKRENQTLLAVQAEQHAGGAAEFGFFNKERHFHGHAVRIGQVQVRCVIDGGAIFGKGRHLGLRAASFHVEYMVDSDAVEPGAELTLAFERAQLGNDLDQHLLGHLFRILRLKDHADGDVVDPRLMSQDEFLERDAITTLGTGHQGRIGRIAVNDFRKRVEHGSAPSAAEDILIDCVP